METDLLTDRMGSVPILSVKRTVSIGTMLYFDGDGDGHGDGDGTFKQAFMHNTENRSAHFIARHEGVTKDACPHPWSIFCHFQGVLGKILAK